MPIALTQCPPVGTLTPTYGVFNLADNKTCLFPFLAPNQGEIDIQVDCYLSEADCNAGGQPLRSITVAVNKSAVIAANGAASAAVLQAALPDTGEIDLETLDTAIRAINTTLVPVVIQWMITNTANDDPQYANLQALFGSIS